MRNIKPKKEKITKESLIKENAKFEAKVERLSNEDYRLRKELSEVLGSKPNRDFGYRSDDVKVLSWEAIIFRLGVLTSQSDIKAMYEENEKLGYQNKSLQIMLKEEREKNNPDKTRHEI